MMDERTPNMMGLGMKRLVNVKTEYYISEIK